MMYLMFDSLPNMSSVALFTLYIVLHFRTVLLFSAPLEARTPPQPPCV